jgi:hypothetical protein
VLVVAVRQNVYPVKGKDLAVYGGKTTIILRIVPLPELVTNRCASGAIAMRTWNGPRSPPVARGKSPTAEHCPSMVQVLQECAVETSLPSEEQRALIRELFF